MKHIILSLLFLSSFLFSGASEAFEGEIDFKISYKNLPEEMGMYKAMLPRKSRVIIKNNWSKIEQNMSPLMKMDIIFNSETSTSLMLINAMGKKIAVEMNDTTEKIDPSLFTLTQKEDIKIIAGYKCRKKIITDTANNSYTLWVTDKLPSYKNQNLPDIDMGGFPMEYNIENNGMSVRMTASKVTEKSISDDEFTIPEGYEKKTAEEMGELMKGMKF